MGHRIAAGILLLFGGIACVCVGAVFAADAVHQAFLPLVGPAWASAATALLLLLAVGLGFAICAARARRPEPPHAEGRPPLDAVATAYLAGLARERPLLAVLLAGLFGAASAVLKNKR
jgi:hypothetical protein